MRIQNKTWLYAGIGFLTPLLPSLESLTPDKIALMSWPQWLVVGLSPVLSVLVTLKALASAPDSVSTINPTKDTPAP